MANGSFTKICATCRRPRNNRLPYLLTSVELGFGLGVYSLGFRGLGDPERLQVLPWPFGPEGSEYLVLRSPSIPEVSFLVCPRILS